MTKYELENMIEEKETELEILKKQLRDIKKEEARKELSKAREILFNHMQYVHIYDEYRNEFEFTDVILCDDGTLKICIEE